MRDLTRALIGARRAFVSKSRRYLVPLPEFAASPSLHQREGMVEELSARILERFGVEGGYFSVLGSDDPDRLPFFCDVPLENELFFNRA